MIELERHIEILLLSNDCVIVPGFGGFMAHHVCARYDRADGCFVPPMRTLGFNPQLTMNDSLLVQSYIEAYDISYPEALRRIEDEVAELRQHLATYGKYELNDIGEISVNDEGRMEFMPCEAGILTPELYGLSTIELLPLSEQRAVAKAEATDQTDAREATTVALVQTETDEADEDPGAIVIKMTWLRTAVSVAAVLLALFFVATPLSDSNSQQAYVSLIPTTLDTNLPTQPAAQLEVPVAEEPTAEAPAVADAAAEEAAEEPAETAPAEEVAPEPTESYVIVMASQTTRTHAAEFVERLAAAGFAEARIVEGKMLRVVYGSYGSDEEAHDALRALRKQHKDFAEAWILKCDK